MCSPMSDQHKALVEEFGHPVILPIQVRSSFRFWSCTLLIREAGEKLLAQADEHD